MGIEFNITSYMDGLRRALNSLPPQGRVSFAVWCADALIREVSDYLVAKTDDSQRLTMHEAFSYLWKCASGEIPADAVVRRLEQACATIDWGQENVADDEQLINRYAIEALSSLCCALETCRTGSTLSASRAAENVINKLDLQLSDELLVDSYSEAIWSAPKWKAELQRQQKMLAFLRDRPGLKAKEKTLFRE